MIGTDAVLKMFVPVCPCSCVILPQPAIQPFFPRISNGIDGIQIGNICVLELIKTWAVNVHRTGFQLFTCILLISEALEQQRQIYLVE